MANQLTNLFGALGLDSTLQAIRNRLPASLGKKTAANSLSVTLSTDESPFVVNIDSVATNLVSSSVSGTDTALTTHSVITGETTAGGGSYVNVKVNPSGALAVSVGDSALPTGAATSALQTTGNTTLSAIDTKLGGTLTVATGLSQPLTNTELRASAVPVNAASLPLPTGAASETTLAALNGKLVSSAEMPNQNAVSVFTRQSPQKYWDESFPQVGSGLLSPLFTQVGAVGTGMAVNQSAGNLVITTGTTANAEVTVRSTQSFTGALTLHQLTTLSQRIVNNNFFVELVDVIGDNLAYTIVNATTVDVTLTAHGYTAANVGQRMDIGVITGAAGIPMEAVIASIPNANTIRFTVAGWPATGTGTCSLTGWNKVELLYTGTTATTLNFNTRRQGWQNTSVAATINTTASGHITATNISNGVASLADQVNTSAGVYANRATWRSNIPEPEVVMFLQLRARNGTVAPASTTTWTIGFTRVEDYVPTQVDIVGTKVQNNSNSFPVNVIGTVPVSGSVTANLGIPGQVTDVASAALTTTTTTAAFTPASGVAYVVNIPVTVVTGTSPTLDVRVEESDDGGTNWYTVYDFPRITATGMYRSPALVLSGNRVRYVQTVGGTTPSFTRAINRLPTSFTPPRPYRQLVDRSIVLTTLNSVTPSLNVQACGNLQMVINVGAITTTAPALQLEGSDDNGVTWDAIGAPATAVANSTVRITTGTISYQLIRARVSTAGVGVTAGYVLLKGF